MRPTQNILFNENNGEATSALVSGIDKVANAVKTTLGPNGRRVVIGKGNNYPRVTKDGVDVSRHINLIDPTEKIGALMMRQAGEKTVSDAGDGTTSSIIIAQALIHQGLISIQNGYNPILLKKEMEEAGEKVLDHLKSMSVQLENDYEKMKQVATISANNDEYIGGLIADAYHKIGPEGAVTVIDSPNPDTTVEVVKGTRIPSGYIAPHFSNNMNKMIAEYSNALVLIVDMVVSKQRDILPALEIAKRSQRPLLVIADDVNNEALQSMIVNKLRGEIEVVAIKSPWHTDRKRETFDDLAILTGATVVGGVKGLKLDKITAEHLGSIQKFTTTKDHTTIIANPHTEEKVNVRAEFLRERIKEETGMEKEILEDRLSKLTGGVAVISVGGNSIMEIGEKKDRIDDAVRATKCAIEEGILPGGGAALLRSSHIFTSMNMGTGIVLDGCHSQLKQLLINNGLTTEESINIKTELLSTPNPFYGYNAKENRIEQLVISGVIEPTKVVRSAFQNALSVAIMVLISGCVIVDEPNFVVE